MQAGAAAFRSATDQAPSFQRSGSTPNCCHRCPSPCTKLVSGLMSKTEGADTSDFRKKYWTCEPGVRRPSGRILVCSLEVVTPSQPEPTPYAPQLVPSHRMLDELVAPAGAVMAQMNFEMPSVLNLGSLSWYMLAQLPAWRPIAEPLFAVGNRFCSAVSQRALFQMCWLQTPPGWVAWLPNWPVLAMYSPKNVPSPGVASTPATSGRLSTPLALVPIVL